MMPADVAERLRALADELGVDDDIIAVARADAAGALDLAGTDSPSVCVGRLGVARPWPCRLGWQARTPRYQCGSGPSRFPPAGSTSPPPSSRP